MAQLDVTDILLDPDFVDTLTIIRRAYVVGTDGISVITPTTFNPIGVIQAGSVEPTVRPADYEQPRDSITVHVTGFTIFGPQQSSKPDLIVFNGNNYVVNKVYSWSNFGAGFTMAEADLQDLQMADGS